ncbi:MAG: YdcF family protein, partial [Candidatus Omnitrophica bacterium]|nr:YdcF family protein [Candidatus Omnitrophota bacterium]
IEEESARKKLDREVRWKENLLVFYKKARKKAVKIAAVCFLLYLLFFETPFMWFLTGPLKISQVPQKADVIVVFGGGVGETGSPGKSTIERARYAAELYNEGYADKIIFSSGYFYIYNDAENMKLIALSMGVPERNIILEQKANSTYENVVFSKAILDKNKWDSILLISSPYHMRRAYFVFNKWKNDIEVTYTPVKICQFYYRPEGLKLSQIKAIVHEYLGIAYYWFKGYI